MVIFPLAPDQPIAQMWSNGARGLRDRVKPSFVIFDFQALWRSALATVGIKGLTGRMGHKNI